jgi:DNA-3-methyladenine glycosylase I
MHRPPQPAQGFNRWRSQRNAAPPAPKLNSLAARLPLNFSPGAAVLIKAASNPARTLRLDRQLSPRRTTMTQRCQWPGADPLMLAYHDTEWGAPLHDDRKLFEFITLEGAQAGLSWMTILRKRENYRLAFDGFDPAKVAAYDEAKVSELLGNAGIVRNRLKIQAAITNARAFLAIQQEFGSFDAYIWGFTGGKPVVNAWRSLSELPAKTALSDTISNALIRRGFKFVGSTIVYAHMQATGMVNDHVVDCYRYAEINAQVNMIE